MSVRETAEYRTWKAMKARCYSPVNANSSYQRNGITVCDRWRNNFSHFLADIGPRPSPDHSLDRIDNNKGYAPENCRWATRHVQSANRGNFNRIFEHNGESLVLKEWARKLSIKYTTLYQRIYRSGLSFAQAIDTDPFDRVVIIGVQSMTVTEWCKTLDRDSLSVFDRVRKGWSIKRALMTKTKKHFSPKAA